jgi:LAO/AO transport system kinase
VAQRARRDLHAALRSLGERDTRVVAVSSVPPSRASRSSWRARRAPRSARPDGARMRARRLGALEDFHAEHGDRGCARSAAAARRQRWLDEQPPALDTAALARALEARAVESGREPAD